MRDDYDLSGRTSGVKSMRPGKQAHPGGRSNAIERRQEDDPDFKTGC